MGRHSKTAEFTRQFLTIIQNNIIIDADALYHMSPNELKNGVWVNKETGKVVQVGGDDPASTTTPSGTGLESPGIN